MEISKLKLFLTIILLAIISLFLSSFFYNSLPFFKKLPVFYNRNTLKIDHSFGTSKENDDFTTVFPKSIVEYKAFGVDCKRFFDNDKNYTMEKIKQQNSMQHPVLSDEDVSKSTIDCQKYRRQYVNFVPTQEEADFPLAFQILTFKDAAQFEYLLKAIYRPHNEYCIHVDKKSKAAFRTAIENIAKCFPNVQVIDKKNSIDVQWGFYTVLEPELVCMENLWKRETKWKYLINLTGQEYPLQTMQDLVKILKVFKGANSLEGTLARKNRERTEKDIYQKPKTPFPHAMNIAKGAVHIVVQRGFVDYVLHDNIALEFRDWLKDTFHPDETFFPSLNHSPNLKIPGAYTGVPETDPSTYPFIARFKNWGGYPFDYPCAGKRVRMVCILSIGDLSLLAKRKELFANKFHMDYQPFALQCMRELITNRTRDGIIGKRNINLKYYESLNMVKHHIGVSP